MSIPLRMRTGQYRWSEILRIATANEVWSTNLSIASSMNLVSVAFAYGPLLQQEALTVAARLSWMALVPQHWESMSKGKRIDSIREIAKESLGASQTEAASLAVSLNQLLERLLVSRRVLELSGPERVELVTRCGGRCALCGREFDFDERLSFVNAQVLKHRPCPRPVYDRWKPIFAMPDGWLIEVDHRAPISSVGDNTLDNLQLACRYCNNVKRERTSIFDVPRVLRAGQQDDIWRFHALRVIASASCHGCEATIRDKELTVGLLSRNAIPTLQNFFATCYGCDPQSVDRFLAVPKQ